MFQFVPYPAVPCNMTWGAHSVCLSTYLGTNMFIQITAISLLTLYQFYKQLRTQQVNKMMVSEGTEI